MNPSAVFTFKYSKGVAFAAPAVIGMLLYFGWAIFRQGHIYAGVGWTTAVLILMIVPGLMMLDQTSNLEINEKGLSKAINNKVWQTVTWDNIKVIKVFKLRIAKDQVKTAMHVYSSHRTSQLINKRMVFSPSDTNARELLNLLSHYVDQHRVPIEYKIGNRWEPASKINIEEAVG